VGRGSTADEAIARLGKSPRTQIVGYVGEGITAAAPLGGFDSLAKVVTESRADVVFIVPNALEPQELEVILAELDSLPVDIKIVPGVPRVHHARMHIMALGELSVVGVERAGLSSWQRALKRGIDITASAAALLVLAPVFAVVALAILIDDGRPVFYRQRRVGLRGKTFELIKFRTMIKDAERFVYSLENELDGLIFKVREDPRVTGLGRWLRRFSIDEFPQFLNILRGEMSLVGPRPPLPEEVSKYDRFLARRLNVRPGATGIWQISGRSDLPFEDYVRYDLTYVENWSVGLDLMIMLRTIPVLLFGKGAY
jgi:exopolysaccharide biosynthesis polyprenyl glycosylphosphotransferase